MRAILIAVLASALLGGAVAKAGTIAEWKIGAWTVAAHTQDNTDRFSHCAGSVEYRSGIALLFSVDSSLQWRMAFFSPNWALTPGQNLTLGLSMDGSRTYKVDGRAHSAQLVIIELAAKRNVFDLFRRGRELTLYAADQTARFRLDGSSAMLTSLLDCAQQYRTLSAGLSPVRPQQPNSAPASPERKTESRDQFRAEATALLANVLATSGLANFRIDAADKTFDAAWRTTDANGGLMVFESMVDKTPADGSIAALKVEADSCKGSFLSGSVPDPEGGAARVFATCSSETTTIAKYYLVTRRPSGGLYIFVTIAVGSEAPAKQADQMIRSAALKSIN